MGKTSSGAHRLQQLIRASHESDRPIAPMRSLVMASIGAARYRRRWANHDVPVFPLIVPRAKPTTVEAAASREQISFVPAPQETSFSKSRIVRPWRPVPEKNNATRRNGKPASKDIVSTRSDGDRRSGAASSIAILLPMIPMGESFPVSGDRNKPIYNIRRSAIAPLRKGV
jgi:hypothetical protein